MLSHSSLGVYLIQPLPLQWLKWLFGLIMSNKSNMLISLTAWISFPVSENEIIDLFLLWKVLKKKNVVGKNPGIVFEAYPYIYKAYHCLSLKPFPHFTWDVSSPFTIKHINFDFHSTYCHTGWLIYGTHWRWIHKPSPKLFLWI